MITVFQENEQGLVSPFNMKPGQYGVIVKWGNAPQYAETIVFRTQKDLISADPLLALQGRKWKEILSSPFDSVADYAIRILPPGTKLLLTVEDPDKPTD